jgi:multidrug resistance efflux pump
VLLTLLLGATLGFGAQETPLIPKATEPKAAQPASVPTVVKSEVEGLVNILELAPEGARVNPGEVIATLDSAALRHALAEQKLRLKQAELTLDVTRRSRQIAELEMKHSAAVSERDAQRLDQMIARAKSNLEAATEQAKVMQGMLEKQMTNPANVQIALRGKLEAEFAHASALSEKAIQGDLGRSLQTLKQQASFENATGNEVFQQAVVDHERSRIAHTEAQIERCLVKSPVEGVVRYANPAVGPRLIDPGLAVHELQIIARIMPTTSPATSP